jgi:tetratricopeptide (TPR) repeat protein
MIERIKQAKLPIAALLVIGFMIAMNAALLRYRQEEIAIHLNLLSSGMKDYRMAGLVGRYSLIGRRMAAKDEGGGDLIEEARLRAMLNTAGAQISGRGGEGILSMPVVAMLVRGYVGAVAFLQGKRAPAAVYSELNDPLLELSYYFERNRHWEKAIRVMEKFMPGETRSYSYRYALLHSGFCYAMLSRNDEAIDCYERLLRNFPDSPEADVAKRLLHYLLAVEKGVTAVLASGAAPDVKGLRLYLLSSYSHALREYNAFLCSASSNHPAYYSALYYRGRSCEELGISEDAIRDFLKIVSEQPGTAWAIKANRRLFIMGTSYGGDRHLALKAEARGAQFNDSLLISSLKVVTGMGYPESISSEAAESKFRASVESGEMKALPPIAVPEAGRKRPEAEAIAGDAGAQAFSSGVMSAISTWEGSARQGSGAYARIETSSGFRLYGIIIREDAREIVIRTEFGTVPVPVATIQSISRIEK